MNNSHCCSMYSTTDEEPIQTPQQLDIPLIVGLSVTGLAVLFLTISVILYVCYTRHLGPWKRQWKVTVNRKSVDVSYPKHVYEGQLEVDKKKGFDTTTNGTTIGTHRAGEASGDNQKRPMSNHIKSRSIRIINDPNDVLPNPASLRAKSVSDVVDIGDGKKLVRNVSQRILPASLPDGGLQMHKSTKYKTDKTKSSNGVARYMPSVYASGHAVKQHAIGGKAVGQSWDYSGGGRSSTYKPNENNEYVYGQVNQYSSPESIANNSGSGSVHGMRKMVELQSIPHDKAFNGSMPKSKIDTAFDEAKRTNKVTEFTDFNKELKLIKLIGKGSFGKVYKAKWDAEFVAVKVFTNVSPVASSHNDMEVAATQQSAGLGGNNSLGNNGLAVENLQITTVDDEQYKELYAEIVLATSIPPHPNIVRINGFCRKPLCVVMEYMGGGSVQKLVYGLTKKPIPNVTEKFVILVKACYGLAKLTEYGLHHRDVAARNILLGDYKTAIDSNTKVKITDFGMTREVSEDDNIQKTENKRGPLKWMAPESIQEQKYNEKTDVYMWGITMWEIMYGREPYENEDAINAAMHAVMKDERPEFLWKLPSGLKTLIKKCWDKEPDMRPTFKFVAKELEKLSRSMKSDIEEIQERHKVVEEELREEEVERRRAKYEGIGAYDNINIKRVDSALSMSGNSGQYDEF